MRKIDAALDLSWLRSELAPHYSSMGRPSIDPELMIRMLVAGYVFAAVQPTQLLQPLPERGNELLCSRIILAEMAQHTDTRYPLGSLRVCGERSG